MRRRIVPNLIGDIAQMEERQERLERVMQMLGVTPEYPYTFNINDGTRNTVQIGLVDGSYGIKIVDNAGNEVILANGTIVANAIKTGTLDCSLLTVTNLNAGSITVGTLSASIISGGTLNCSLMTVANLSASVITTGVFLSPNDRFSNDSLSGVKISGNTIAAGKIVANSINSDQIASHGISADCLNVATLEAITANCGHITAGTIDADTVNVNNLNASNLNRGTIYVGYSGSPTGLYIKRGSMGDAKFYFEGGSRMWADSSNRIGINSLGSPMYIYINSWDKIIIPEDGQVTIKGGVYITATSGAGNLNVEGDIRVNGKLAADFDCNQKTLNNVWIINNTHFYGNNVWYWNLNYYSDEKLKKNIKVLNSNLESVLSLTPKEFEYKADKESKRRFGFMASEVEEVLPELVSTDDKGNKGIDITEMIPLLVGAIKELKKEVELLKKGGV